MFTSPSLQRLALAALLLLWGGGLLGCGNGLQRVAVRGQVTVAGAPLKAGRILFVPAPPLKGPVASAAVVEGAYTIPAKEGPVAGAHRVEVEAALTLGFAIDDEAAFAQRGGAPLPPNPIPGAFNRQSTLVAQLKAGNNVYDVTVPP